MRQKESIKLSILLLKPQTTLQVSFFPPLIFHVWEDLLSRDLTIHALNISYASDQPIKRFQLLCPQYLVRERAIYQKVYALDYLTLLLQPPTILELYMTHSYKKSRRLR